MKMMEDPEGGTPFAIYPHGAGLVRAPNVDADFSCVPSGASADRNNTGRVIADLAPAATSSVAR